MFPKLLTQSELDSRKSADRRREVEEGAKLARRVDGLRELAAETEKNVEQHRSASLAQAQTEINAALSKKELLETEVRELEEERKRLQIPLDAAWEKIRTETERIEAERIVLAQRGETIRQNALEQENEKRELALEKERISSERERSSSALSHAEKKHAKADSILLEAHDRKEEIEQWTIAKLREIAAKETKVYEREQDAILMAEQNEEQKQQNSNDRRQLIDAYETLARTKKRLGI